MNKTKTLNFSRATILLTGGTGSFGTAFVSHLLSKKTFKGIIRIFSRDEFKQYQLQQLYPDDLRLRYFIGDVRDPDRLRRAAEGVDIIVHAAALKQIPVAEYNPFEVVKTNILGSQNVVDAAIDAQVPRTVLISSDKAVHPINLYGASKLTAERIFIQGNVYASRRESLFSVARYGNVLGSRGSVVPLFLKQKKSNLLTITDKKMTRFWITLPQAAELVEKALKKMKGGEIFIPKLPSVKITDLAKAINPKAKLKLVGIRPGEKLHEELIPIEESNRCIEYRDYYLIIPQVERWTEKEIKARYPRKRFRQESFSYDSNDNDHWLTIDKIRQEIAKTLKQPIGE